MSNHKLTVANLCVKSNSLWTNFADIGKIHTRMYNVCTMYTTAVGVILPRQLACLFAPKWIWYLVQRLLDAGSWTRYRQTVRGKMLAGKCWRESVWLAALARHTLRLWALTRPSAQPTVSGQGKGKGRAITYEQLFICQTHVECLQSLIFATNGKIGRFEFAP